ATAADRGCCSACRGAWRSLPRRTAATPPRGCTSRRCSRCQRLVAPGLERVAFVPVRPLLAVGQRAADGVDGLQVLDRAVQLPGRRVVLVGGVVVAVVAVVLGRGGAGGLAPFQQVLATVHVQRRHAG